MASDLYRTDVHAWSLAQADLLRRRAFDELDIDNVIDEIESVGKQVERDLERQYGDLIIRLLKWQLQAAFRCQAWRDQIRMTRAIVADEESDNPSMAPMRSDIFGGAYGDAMVAVMNEIGRILPENCPFTLAQAMAEDFWPEA